MNLAEELLSLITSEGVMLKDKNNVRNSLINAIANNRYKVILNEKGEEVGFLTWFEKSDKGRVSVFVNNLLILKKHKGECNLLKIRTWFRKRYPMLNLLYWTNRKKQKLFHNRQGGRKCNS